MKTFDLRLNGLKLVEPDVFRDERGFFLETWSAERYENAGIGAKFVQDNHSRSSRGTLRGLHYQAGEGQAKLVRVARGRILDVAVDIRPDSPTFGEWEAVVLDEDSQWQLFVPAGFSHGFCVLSEVADVIYRVDRPYSAALERTIAWNDPEIGVDWTVSDPLLSARDQAGESFASYREGVKA